MARSEVLQLMALMMRKPMLVPTTSLARVARFPGNCSPILLLRSSIAASSDAGSTRTSTKFTRPSFEVASCIGLRGTMIAPFSTTDPPSTMPTTLKSLISIMTRSPTFLFKISAANLPSTTACSSPFSGSLPSSTFNLSQVKPPHSRPDTMMSGVSSTLSICMSTVVVSLTPSTFRDFSLLGFRKRLGHDTALNIAHDDVDADYIELLRNARFVAVGHANEGDDCGDADGDSAEGEGSADGTSPEAAEYDGEKCHDWGESFSFR